MSKGSPHEHQSREKEELSFSGQSYQDVFAAVDQTRTVIIAGTVSLAETMKRARAMRRWVKEQPLMPTVKDTLRNAIGTLELTVKYQKFNKTLSARRSEPQSPSSERSLGVVRDAPVPHHS